AKFLRGLASCTNPRDLTVIGNTADDADIWGLHVSPDLDTLTYALTGRLDLRRGWGLADDSFNALAAMAALGGETWFRLGDRDLATHIYRTRALGAGRSLSEVTAAIGRALGLGVSLLAISPIVGGAPVSGPAGDLMRACGLPVTAAGVARAYAPWLDLLVIDRQDSTETHAVLEFGAEPVLAETLLTDHDREVALARRVLEVLA